MDTLEESDALSRFPACPQVLGAASAIFLSEGIRSYMMVDVKLPALLIFVSLASGWPAVLNANPRDNVDLEKMGDPKTRLKEVARLATSSEDTSRIKAYQWLKAEQAGSQPPLHVLCAAYSYESSDRDEL